MGCDRPMGVACDRLNHLHMSTWLSAGPVNIHERVLRAMNVPGQNHRDPFFAPFFKDLLHDSK